MAESSILSFPNESITFIAPGWNLLHEHVFTLAKAMRTTQAKFDRVVTLAKGGWPMSRSLADFLEVNEVQSLGLRFYTGIDERLSRPVVYQELPVDIAGEHILLFDDIADTGESLSFSVDYLTERGAASITTACVYYKERSRIRPDYFAATVREWVVFPYELVETLRILGTRWLSEGVSPEAVSERFAAFQFDPAQISYFLEELLLN